MTSTSDWQLFVIRTPIMLLAAFGMSLVIDQAFLCRAPRCFEFYSGLASFMETILLGAPGHPILHLVAMLEGAVLALGFWTAVDWRKRSQGIITIIAFLAGTAAVYQLRNPVLRGRPDIEWNIAMFLVSGGVFITFGYLWQAWQGQEFDPKSSTHTWAYVTLVVILAAIGFYASIVDLVNGGPALGVFTLPVLGVYLGSLFLFYFASRTTSFTVLGGPFSGKSVLVHQVKKALESLDDISDVVVKTDFAGFTEDDLLTRHGNLPLDEIEDGLNALEPGDPFPYADTQGITPIGFEGMVGDWFPEKHEWTAYDHDGEVTKELIEFLQNYTLRQASEYHRMRVRLRLGKTFDEIADEMGRNSRRDAVIHWLGHEALRSDISYVTLDVGRVLRNDETHLRQVNTLVELLNRKGQGRVEVVPTKADIWIHEAPGARHANLTIEEMEDGVIPDAGHWEEAYNSNTWSMREWLQPPGIERSEDRDPNPIYQQLEETLRRQAEQALEAADSAHTYPVGFETVRQSQVLGDGGGEDEPAAPDDEDGFNPIEDEIETLNPGDWTDYEDVPERLRDYLPAHKPVDDLTGEDIETAVTQARASAGVEDEYVPKVTEHRGGSEYHFHGAKPIAKKIVDKAQSWRF